MKKLIVIGVTSMLLAGTATNTAGAYRIDAPQRLTKQIAQSVDTLDLRSVQIQERMQDLYKHVGKTAYVFSGSKPSGWDCSGLVMWFYSDLGVVLPHSATKQKQLGKNKRNGELGDIVVFSTTGSRTSYHTGIYAGNGFFIHAPREGKLTELALIEDFVDNNTEVSFVKVNF